MVKIRKFKLFPKLAPELRAMIFELALPDGQIISVFSAPFDWESMGIEKLNAQYKIPALLHTNREARSLASNFYPEMFADRFGGNPIRLNIARDVLTFKEHGAALVFFGTTLDEFIGMPPPYARVPVPNPPSFQIPRIALVLESEEERARLLVPEIFQTLGCPEQIFVLMPNTRLSDHQRFLTLLMQREWRDVITKAKAIDLPICSVDVVMYKTLNAILKQLGPHTRMQLPEAAVSRENAENEEQAQMQPDRSTLGA